MIELLDVGQEVYVVREFGGYEKTLNKRTVLTISKSYEGINYCFFDGNGIKFWAHENYVFDLFGDAVEFLSYFDPTKKPEPELPQIKPLTLWQTIKRLF